MLQTCICRQTTVFLCMTRLRTNPQLCFMMTRPTDKTSYIVGGQSVNQKVTRKHLKSFFKLEIKLCYSQVVAIILQI